MADLSDTLDVFGRLRYGVPTSEKEAIAIRGDLPGAPVDHTADQDAANRYASGFLFAQEHPTLAPMVMPFVDRVRTGLFGDSPEMQSYATAGMNQALMGATARAPQAALQAKALRSPQPRPSEPQFPR